MDANLLSVLERRLPVTASNAVFFPVCRLIGLKQTIASEVFS